jgi:hypothetical protein
MSKAFALTASLLLLPLVANAQLKTQSAKFRDAPKEDEVARLFENTRKQAGAKPLSRIKFRNEIQELVCTAALTGRVPDVSSGIPERGSDGKWHPTGILFYRTTEPGNVTDEMKKLAAYDPLRKRGFKRYSVAVWKSALSDQEGQYWVGIQFYWSEAMEFFDYHFTDDISYHNAWKNEAASECRRP